ncbi:septum formation initiator family protein [Buchnera aphidicola]|uniref:Cell division protein FtsB n=1 Tax=Buchnera aphidicola subsp. Melaphis rhois TaxID=118103 RepID=A0A4D6YAK9_BUCMH|nr:septum formation initiator family protein [Buchnera aphidicola]QCI23391.1 cell division protein FtsB [Buchnera aphidicola (Melaphis rhois)]
MIVIKVALLILLCWLQINFFLGKNGLFEYIKLNKQILQKKLEIFYLVERNVKLLSEIQYWNNSNELIEEYARSNLGMIKKDEIFYRILIDN